MSVDLALESVRRDTLVLGKGGMSHVKLVFMRNLLDLSVSLLPPLNSVTDIDQVSVVTQF